MNKSDNSEALSGIKRGKKAPSVKSSMKKRYKVSPANLPEIQLEDYSLAKELISSFS